GRVVELRRTRERLLPPRALDRLAVRGDPGDATADDLGLETMLVRVAVVERAELHQHDHHVLRSDPPLRRGVLLLALDADRAQIRVRRSVVIVADRARRVGEGDLATDRSLLEREVGAELPDRLVVARLRAKPPSERIELLAGGV